MATNSLSVTALTLTALGALAQPAAMVETIKLGEVDAAQEAWCDALVAISRTHAKGGLDRSKPLAVQVIDGAYGYQYGPVAFKTTWAKGEPSVKSVREQFHILSEITQPLTILASRLEPLVPSVALG